VTGSWREPSFWMSDFAEKRRRTKLLHFVLSRIILLQGRAKAPPATQNVAKCVTDIREGTESKGSLGGQNLVAVYV